MKALIAAAGTVDGGPFAGLEQALDVVERLRRLAEIVHHAAIRAERAHQTLGHDAQQASR